LLDGHTRWDTGDLTALTLVEAMRAHEIRYAVRYPRMSACRVWLSAAASAPSVAVAPFGSQAAGATIGTRGAGSVAAQPMPVARTGPRFSPHGAVASVGSKGVRALARCAWRDPMTGGRPKPIANGANEA